MSKIFLLFGGNLENPINTIQLATFSLEKAIGSIIKKSSFYESEPWGFEHKNNFINQITIFETKLKPEKILDIILKTEEKFGRKRDYNGYAARTIDIDILFYDDLIVETKKLQIPHPRINERKFVLEPLFEIEPDLLHPKEQKTIRELFEKCEDSSMLKKMSV